MRGLFFTLAICTASFAYPISLKEKLMKGQPGDYIVSEQGNTYTVLILRSLNEKSLSLEEINIPSEDAKIPNWKKWVAAKAPGNTAWVAYKINLEKGVVTQGYSHSRQAFLYLRDPDHFLSKLLSLSLTRTPEDKRRRIGPAPVDGGIDYRAFWSPPVIFEGKKVEKPAVTAWTAKWPVDDSILADCEVELYFGTFPFPYWIDIKHPHYRFSVRTIDSGHGLSSPMPEIPDNPNL